MSAGNKPQLVRNRDFIEVKADFGQLSWTATNI